MPILLAEILIFFGVIGTVASVRNLIKGIKAKNWPTASGTVVDSQITVKYNDEGNPLYGAEVKYRFNVEGMEFNSNRRTFADHNSSDKGRAEIITSIYAPGTPVQVYYSPDNPEDSVLESGTNSTMFVALAITLILVGIGVAGLLRYL